MKELTSWFFACLVLLCVLSYFFSLLLIIWRLGQDAVKACVDPDHTFSSSYPFPSIPTHHPVSGVSCGREMMLFNLQCWDVLLVWKTVRQGLMCLHYVRVEVD